MADQNSSQSGREIAALRALVAEFVDVYGYVGVPTRMQSLAKSCRSDAISDHVGRLIADALNA